ncbi:MAG: DNA repair protein RecO [bacterium]|nr:DNA repair protein RecO [bacterium]
MGIVTRPSAATDALVLRAWPCGETSAIASLLTRDHGYVKVIAKAARRPLSTLRPLVEPGRLVSVEFSLDPVRELQYLRGGSVELDPLGPAPTLELSAYLLGALELVDRCRPAGALVRDDPGGAAELFGVCDAFLRMLSSQAGSEPVAIFFAFEWELLDRHGVSPELSRCCACGASRENVPVGTRRFSAAEGGLMCGECARGGADEGCRALGDEALAVFDALEGGGLDGARGLALTPVGRREVGGHLHRFLGYHLPGYRLPAALDLLRAGKASAS